MTDESILDLESAFSNNKNKSSKPITASSISSLEMRKTNLEAKRALFEAKKSAEAAVLNKQNSVYSEQNSVFSRQSKLRHTVHQSSTQSNVTNRIIKFESRSELAQKYLGTEDPVLAKSNTDNLSIKRVSSNQVNPTTDASIPISPDKDSVESSKQKKEKVRSISKNWEQMTNGSRSPDKSSSLFNFGNQNVVEKIEKFNSNNLIQLISKQPNNETSEIKKPRANSGK